MMGLAESSYGKELRDNLMGVIVNFSSKTRF